MRQPAGPCNQLSRKYNKNRSKYNKIVYFVAEEKARCLYLILHFCWSLKRVKFGK